VNKENKGFGFACNQGAMLGSSEHLLFLNPDVRLFEDSLSGSVAFMQTSPGDKIGILGIQLIDQHGNIQRNVARFPSTASLFYQMLGLDRIWPGRFPPHFMTEWTHLDSRVVDQVPGAFMLIRRSLFENLNGFDQQFFMYYEDLDLAFRARKAGWVSYYLTSVRAFHHGGGTTDQVKASRLFYLLCSRSLYAAKHFGFHQALWIMIASIAFEIWIRLAWNIVHRSARNFQETLQAYFLYIKEIPALFRKIRK
jgi:GT2 family glycosyltransferase